MTARLVKIGTAYVDLLKYWAPNVLRGNFQQYSSSPFAAYTGMWAVYIVPNIQFTVSLGYDPATFPAGTVFTWNVTPDPGWSSVNGYLAASYGNYDNSPNSITPRKVDNITTLTVNGSWSWTGSNASGMLSEMWLTSTSHASGVLTDKTHEVGFVPKVSPASATYLNSLAWVGSGSYTDSNGVAWNVRQGISGTNSLPYLLAFRPGFVDFKGAFLWRDYLTFLKTSGAITGQEWFNGVAYGAEPLSGGSSLRIDSLNVTYN